MQAGKLIKVRGEEGGGKGKGIFMEIWVKVDITAQKSMVLWAN